MCGVLFDLRAAIYSRIGKDVCVCWGWVFENLAPKLQQNFLFPFLSVCFAMPFCICNALTAAEVLHLLPTPRRE